MGANRSNDSKKIDSCCEGSKSRCVVLVQRENAPPTSLLNGLVNRGADPLVVKHPVEVMVALASNRRAVVVVDQPEAVNKLPFLLDAIRRYYPQIACWGYRASNHGRPAKLARIDRVHPSPAKQTIVAPPIELGKRSTRPMTPLAKAATDEKVSTSMSPQLAHESEPLDQEKRLCEPLLTSEELSMLIGPEFGDDGDIEPTTKRDPDPSRGIHNA